VADNYQSELNRRHKAASTTVLGMIVGAILLAVIAYLSRGRLTVRQNPPLATGILIAMFFFGIGAIALRRTRFAAMRLQDVAALKGASGLLQTLEKTTLQVALLGIANAVVGLIATLMTGDESFTYRGSVVAVAVLLYCYPTKTSWERALKQFAEDGALLPPKTTLT
jgi:hypothetical protein